MEKNRTGVWVVVQLLAMHLALAESADQSLMGARWEADKASDQIQIENPGGDGSSVDILIPPGTNAYPGVRVFPRNEKSWDLAEYSHVEARIRNTGDFTLQLNLRLDNTVRGKGNTWNTEAVKIQPGEIMTLKTAFGYQYGYQEGYALDASEITSMLLFVSGTRGKQVSFSVESLVASGNPGDDPKSLFSKTFTAPVDGYLIGGASSRDLMIDTSPGGVGVVSDGVRVKIPGAEERQWIRVKTGRAGWNLRNASEVVFDIRNEGIVSVVPEVWLRSQGGKETRRVAADRPLPPGGQTQIEVPFASEQPWRGHVQGEEGKSTEFASNKVESLFLATATAAEAELVIESVKATDRPAQTPDWLGKRPPVPGEWQLTFHDDFDGDRIDDSKWNVYGPNYWGRKDLTHWSRENVVVANGLATIRLEKKTGYHNDDPNQHQSAYAGGYLDTYDKWRQRYGYFEARMKLPTAPGLWPAFWMMPDRGSDAGPMWKRQNTGDGGMEFDIMEHLTRWGPFRYHIAMHWDGYGKGHKSTGASHVYFRHASDGFFTSGLLWTPGEAVFYCNGNEVGRYESDRISNLPAMMIFTLPIGGWDNDPLDDEKLPGYFSIDYVKVWQRSDLR